MLDGQLVDAFASGFFGYGDYRARYWFIGMEEGGGNSEEEIARRLDTWSARGRRELEDLAEFHAEIGVTQWFEKGKLQTTWRGLIRIVLAAQGLTPTTEDVRAYQRKRLGHIGDETCLLEIMPLPSPRLNAWDYDKLVDDHRFASRKAYVDAFWSSRLAHIQQRIDQHPPAFVIVYGSSCANFVGTRVVSIKHPGAWGLRNDYFAAVGASLR